MDNFPYLIRFGEPSHLDTAEYGTLCKVSNNNEIQYFIQLSTDSEKPKWAIIDSINEKEVLEKANQLRMKN